MKNANAHSKIPMDLFRSPTKEYRSAPFWAWNCALNREVLEEEIEIMRRMGFGGFYMHTRLNMATPYMSEEFLDMVGACVEKGKNTGMIPRLYDEDRYPSGDAGGMVRDEDDENRQKYLCFRFHPYEDESLNDEDRKKAIRFGGYRYVFLACYDVLLRDDGYLEEYKRIALGDTVPVGHEKWFAYMEYAEYCDVLQKSTAESFIRHTHEVYKRRFGKALGTEIPSIFTDEPQMRAKRPLVRATDKGAAILPYTSDLPDSFERAYGVDLLAHLPVLIWERADGGISPIRYDYHKHITDRFSGGYIDTVGAWCAENGLKLTGHVMGEEKLETQTLYVGEAMRHYRNFDLPGVDMLCDHRELNTVKQAQSVARQYGRAGIVSELYGVTNWDFDFRGHKLQGDWQAALGVVQRVPHLYWASMGGEAKRDYPASIGHQSAWYTEYHHLEDHFARIHTVMTRGKAEVGIAVIHPIETYWLHFGPADHTGRKRAELDEKFEALTEWLLYSLNDFDFVCESLLPEQWRENGKGFSVGEMNYRTVIVPFMETIRSGTLDALERFRQAGGEIIFFGGVPEYVDGVASDRAEKLAERCIRMPWSSSVLLEHFEKEKFIEVSDATGGRVGGLVHQVRCEGENKYVFLSHIEKADPDAPEAEKLNIRFRGEWTVYGYDTFAGTRRRLCATYPGGNTEIAWHTGAYSSLLVELIPGRDTEAGGYSYREPVFVSAGCPVHRATYMLSEDNVLILDRAGYSVDGGEWEEPLDVLKIDQILRRKTGQSLATGRFRPQPWRLKREDDKAVVSLRFRVNSLTDFEGAHLGLEYPEYTEAFFNGEALSMEPDGYFVDRAISTVKLPKIRRGSNELVIRLRYGNMISVEPYWILGQFGVENDGYFNTITKLPETLCFRSITEQGFPFYGGNIRYSFDIAGSGKKYIEISKYRGAVIKVLLDGKEQGYIDFPPYRLCLGELSEGGHRVELILFATRINTFGQLHSVYDRIPWPGPDSWRTKDRFWTDEYMLRRVGILTAPRILTEKQ